jgi:hypothetical protein
VNILIFSTNKAMQLEACIRSIKDNYKDFQKSLVTVLYRATNKSFARGYDIVKEYHPDVNFVQETDFRIQVLENLYSNFAQNNSYSMFLADDDLFISSFSLKDRPFDLFNSAKDKVASLSLRLYKKIDKHHKCDTKQIPPSTFSRGHAWKWSMSSPGDWSYPMSINGNIYCSSFIRHVCSHINFHNSNTLEANLSLVRPLPETMLCYPERSKLVNNPIAISHAMHNIFEKTETIEDLNTMLIDGNIIDFWPVQNIPNNMVHYPFSYSFLKSKELKRL